MSPADYGRCRERVNGVNRRVENMWIKGKEEKEKGGKEKIKISGGFERDSNYVLGIKFNVTAEVQTVEEKRKSRK